MAFLRDRQIMTVRDYMEPALRARIGRFSPGPREFFTEVDYRDPEVMRTHGYHWFDKGRMVASAAREPDPARPAALQHLHHAHRRARDRLGRDDDARRHVRRAAADARADLHPARAARRPRARRSEDARREGARSKTTATFTAAHTPRGWLRLEGNLVRFEQHLYLQQPGYGISYVVGKIEIEKLLADRKRQLGDRFTMTQFMDEFDAGRSDSDVAPALGADRRAGARDRAAAERTSVKPILRPAGSRGTISGDCLN